MISTQTTLQTLTHIATKIDRLCEKTGYNEFECLSQMEIDPKNPNDLFFEEELNLVVEELARIAHHIHYLALPIIDIGLLHRGTNDQFETKHQRYTAGMPIEYLAPSYEDEPSRWVRSFFGYDEDYFIHDCPWKLEGLTIRSRGY